MRLYAVADIHGKPAKIERIRKVLSESKPDTLVVAGDIANYLKTRCFSSKSLEIGIIVNILAHFNE